MGRESDDKFAGVPQVLPWLPERLRGPKDEGNWFVPAVKRGWMEINALWAQLFPHVIIGKTVGKARVELCVETVMAHLDLRARHTHVELRPPPLLGTC